MRLSEYIQSGEDIVSDDGSADIVVAPVQITMVISAARGAKGDRGDMGISPFELAQEAGFEGTQAEWVQIIIDSSTAGIEANASATLATTKAFEAQASATAAAAAEDQAEIQKAAAQASANLSSTKAGEASASATLASTKAGEAAASATTASTKATEANAAATEAAGHAASAATSKTDANAAKVAAQAAKDTAQTSAENADASATAAAGSATAAGVAKNAAVAAQTAAETAKTSVDASAATAGTKATEAAGSATTASTKAGEAAASATAAAGSATTASTAAGTATTKAGEASASATAAGTAKTGSETARDASVAAKVSSESARDAAITAKNDAQTAQAAAAQSALDAANAAEGNPPSDEAYGISWNGVVGTAPSKNAVYDALEAFNAAKGNLSGGNTWANTQAFTGNIQLLNGPTNVFIAYSGSGIGFTLTTATAGQLNIWMPGFGDFNDCITIDTTQALFRMPVAVPDDAYAVGWNGSLRVPTKNAVYDEMEVVRTLANSKIASSVAGAFGLTLLAAASLAAAKTSLAYTKADIGLSSVDNTADNTKAVLSATKLTTARTINGVNFDGTGNITINAVDATARIASTEKGIAGGVVPLDGSGKIASSYLPPIALVKSTIVASQAAQLALVAEEGDVAIRSDEHKSYMRNAGTAGTMADWNELLTPTDTVLSVNGQTGVVSLTKADLGLGSVDNTADTAKVVLSASKLTTARNINGVAFDGSVSITIPAVDTATPRLASSAVSAFMLTVLDDANATAALATLGAQAALGYTPTSVTGLTGTQSVAAFKTGLSLVKADVGLGSVDNTADSAKPVSTAQQTALNGKAALRSTVSAKSASYVASDTEHDNYIVYTGAGQTLTLGNITAGTSFTGRFSTAWSIACAAGLSKNGASPTGVTTGSIAAGKLVTFFHEGAGVWVVSGDVT